MKKNMLCGQKPGGVLGPEPGRGINWITMARAVMTKMDMMKPGSIKIYTNVGLWCFSGITQLSEKFI